MKFPFKRILIYSLCLVLVFSCVFPLASSTASAFSLDVLTDNFSVTTLWEMVQGTDCVGISDYLSAITSKTDDGCTVSEDGYHLWLCRDYTVGLFTNAFPIYCAYCNENYASYIDKESLDSSDIEDIYQDYVSTLDSTIASCSSVSNYTCSFYKAVTFGSPIVDVVNWPSISYSSFYNLYAYTTFLDSSSFYVTLEGSSLYPSEFVNTYISYSFSPPVSGYYYFSVPSLFSCSSSCYRLFFNDYVVFDGSIVSYDGSPLYFSSDEIYYFCLWAFACPCVAGTYYFYLDSELLFVPYFGFSSYFNDVHNYNTTNNYTDNSDVVNYYIGTTDDTGDVTNVYNVSLYDEASLIFTEPVTETQYQTTGWTYDYTTRTYTLDLDSGTFYIGDYDIDTIDLTYGVDALTITYYADGVAITTDEYVYVMVSQSECALNGHTYSLEDYQAPTCVDAGYYDYVCSVCGNEYLETIDATGEHSYEYSIYQEPSCTTDGIGLYTCSVCGDQTVESINATGHDWVASSSDTTSYSFPDGESCPDCGSESFTYELDTSSETYTVTCSDCGTTWTVDADVTYGGTTYTCSICGETYFASDDPNDSDSLFGAIANFISSGISWIIEKFTSLIESISGLIDTFNEYVATLSSTSGSFPAFLAGVVAAIPDELTVILWFAVIAFVVAAVWKRFFM